MILHSIMISEKEEISSEVLSINKVKLLTTSRNSRLAVSAVFLFTSKGWINLTTTNRASSLESHLLSYSVGKWKDAGGDNLNQLKSDVAKFLAQPTDLENQRQTNSFQGKNWK